MLNVVKSLLFRLKKSAMFWVMLGICVALPIFTLLLTEFVLNIANIFAPVTADEIGLSDLVYITLSGLATPYSIANFLTLLCVSIFLCKEFSDGTIRNTLLSNKSRVQLYRAYALTALIIGGSFLVAYFVSTLLALGIPFGFGSATFGQWVISCLTSLLLGLLSLVFVITCVLMFMFTTGKQSSSIILPLLVMVFLPNIISSAVELISGLLYMIKMLAQNGSVDVPFDFFMDGSWIPLYNATLFDASNVSLALIGKISLYYALFGGLFIFLGRLSAVKRDLK